MDRLPPDMFRSLINYLDAEDIPNTLLLNRQISQNISRGSIWIDKIRNEFGLSRDDIERYRGNNTYLAYYKNLVDTFVGNPNYSNVIRNAARNGRLDIIKIILNSDTNAARDGRLDINKIMLNNAFLLYSNDLDIVFDIAVYNGHDHVLEYLLEWDPDSYPSVDITYEMNDEALRSVIENNRVSTLRVLLSFPGIQVEPEHVELAQELRRSNEMIDMLIDNLSQN